MSIHQYDPDLTVEVVGLGVVVVLVNTSRVTSPTDLASVSSLLSISLTPTLPSANSSLIASSSETYYSIFENN